MQADFQTIHWDNATAEAARRLVRMALAEDLGGLGDVTSHSLIAPEGRGAAQFVVRESGVVAGLPILPLVAQEAEADLIIQLLADDGQMVSSGDAVARVEGAALDLLTCERTMLNFLGRLSGVATLTHRFVKLVEETAAKVYDTRKTTPGWRRLEKYAVHCGGGRNHRLGLHDAVLIKDNHLAFAAGENVTPGKAVALARQNAPAGTVIEVEVDTLDQLREVLPTAPDIVLLDNMPPEVLTQAVRLRDEQSPGVVLEASGGIRLETVAAVAASGVDRISSGALTHSSGSLDIGLDWGG